LKLLSLQCWESLAIFCEDFFLQFLRIRSIV
jgi:hypothetical protein